VRVSRERWADLDRAADRRLRTIEKDKRHSIAGGDPNQFVRRFRSADLLAVADDLGKLFLELALFVEEQLRVTDHVHEQDVPDLQLKIRSRIYSHITSARQRKSSALPCLKQ